MSRQRPFSISLAAILSVVAALLMFAGGIVLVAAGPGLRYEGDAAIGIGINYLIAAGIDLVIAVGLWRLWTPIRSFAIGYAVVSLVVVIPLIIIDTSTASLIAQGIAAAVILVVFLDFGVRAAFDPIPVSTIESD